jgi:hypothetical protein
VDLADIRRLILALRSGRFGTAGTPGIRVNTNWSTSDIWLRREITLPGMGVDPADACASRVHDEEVEIYFDGVLAARAGGFVTDYEAMEISARLGGCSGRGRRWSWRCIVTRTAAGRGSMWGWRRCRHSGWRTGRSKLTQSRDVELGRRWCGAKALCG